MARVKGVGGRGDDGEEVRLYDGESELWGENGEEDSETIKVREWKTTRRGHGRVRRRRSRGQVERDGVALEPVVAALHLMESFAASPLLFFVLVDADRVTSEKSVAFRMQGFLPAPEKVL